MKKGVVYFLVNAKRAAVGVVSMWAIRKFYTGPVHVLTSSFKDGHVIAERIVEDKRLSLTSTRVPLVEVNKHAIHTSKTWLHRYTPFDSTVFFDADTIPIADFDEVWPQQDEMVLTQFSNWKSSGARIKSRIHWWDDIRPDLVEPAIVGNYAAVNTGVFGFTGKTAMLEPWHEVTCQGFRTFIPDEIAAQLIYFNFEHRMLDDRFNCSPVFGKHVEDVRVWHCHGGKHLRPPTEKLWRSLFKECWQENIGGVTEWLSRNERKVYC